MPTTANNKNQFNSVAKHPRFLVQIFGPTIPGLANPSILLDGIRLCLVGSKVWILVEIEDDVTEKLCVYDRLM